MLNTIRSSWAKICLSSILFFSSTLLFASHPVDNFFTIKNETTQNLYVYTNIDEYSHDGSSVSFINGSCSANLFPSDQNSLCVLAPQEAIVVHLSAENSSNCPACTNNYDDQAPGGSIRIWGLNGTVLYYQLWYNTYNLPYSTYPSTYPSVVDGSCANHHGNPDWSYRIIAYVPPANSDTPYPKDICSAGETQAGNVCMAYDSDSESCWKANEYFHVNVFGNPINTNRSLPATP